MKLRNTRNRARRAAFTLMEMMVVVAIIVALAGASIYYMAGQIDEGYKARVQANVKQLSDVMTQYKAQHQGSWPTSLQDLLVKDPNTGIGPYIKNQEDLMDPWGNQYQFDPNGGRNQGIQPDVWTSHPTFGMFGNWSNRWQR
jgi:general secretion pathway protein G